MARCRLCTSNDDEAVIEQLAEKSTYLEVAYLLLNGELPNAEQLAKCNAKAKKA